MCKLQVKSVYLYNDEFIKLFRHAEVGIDALELA